MSKVHLGNTSPFAIAVKKRKRTAFQIFPQIQLRKNGGGGNGGSWRELVCNYFDF